MRTTIFSAGTIYDDIIREIESNTISRTRACFDQYCFTKVQLKKLAAALENNTHLIYLNLFDCKLDQHDAKDILLPALEKNKTLTDILINSTLGKIIGSKIENIINRNKNKGNIPTLK